jgi:hypothetical protein
MGWFLQQAECCAALPVNFIFGQRDYDATAWAAVGDLQWLDNSRFFVGTYIGFTL